MKRTDKGYETESYYVERVYGTDIYSCKKTIIGWNAINKVTGEKIFYVYLKDFKEAEQRERDELRSERANYKKA